MGIAGLLRGFSRWRTLEERILFRDSTERRIPVKQQKSLENSGKRGKKWTDRKRTLGIRLLQKESVDGGEDSEVSEERES